MSKFTVSFYRDIFKFTPKWLKIDMYLLTVVLKADYEKTFRFQVFSKIAKYTYEVKVEIMKPPQHKSYSNSPLVSSHF